MAAKVNLAIRNNNTAEQVRCSLCGAWDEMTLGPVITLAGTWGFVCDDCAAQHDPELFTLLQIWRQLRNAFVLRPRTSFRPRTNGTDRKSDLIEAARMFWELQSGNFPETVPYWLCEADNLENALIITRRRLDGLLDPSEEPSEFAKILRKLAGDDASIPW